MTYNVFGGTLNLALPLITIDVCHLTSAAHHSLFIYMITKKK